jgi:hypothetical protein
MTHYTVKIIQKDIMVYGEVILYDLTGNELIHYLLENKRNIEHVFVLYHHKGDKVWICELCDELFVDNDMEFIYDSEGWGNVCPKCKIWIDKLMEPGLTGTQFSDWLLGIDE